MELRVARRLYGEHRRDACPVRRLAYKASVDVAADLRAGRLVRLLEQYEGEAVPISAVMPSGRFVTARVRAMVDYLAQRFAGIER